MVVGSIFDANQQNKTRLENHFYHGDIITIAKLKTWAPCGGWDGPVNSRHSVFLKSSRTAQPLVFSLCFTVLRYRPLRYIPPSSHVRRRRKHKHKKKYVWTGKHKRMRKHKNKELFPSSCACACVVMSHKHKRNGRIFWGQRTNKQNMSSPTLTVTQNGDGN